MAETPGTSFIHSLYSFIHSQTFLACLLPVSGNNTPLGLKELTIWEEKDTYRNNDNTKAYRLRTTTEICSALRVKKRKNFLQVG